MSPDADLGDPVWLLCEAGERWYRAVCRFAPELFGSGHPLRVERLGIEPGKLATAIARQAGRRVIVLWELPIDDTAELCNRLDVIASVRSEATDALQLAWLPSAAAPELFLAAREAGIAVFLESIESLQRLGETIDRPSSPLG